MMTLPCSYEEIAERKAKAQHIMEYAEKRMLEENEIGNEPLTRYWAAYRDGAYRVFYELFERDGKETENG